MKSLGYSEIFEINCWFDSFISGFDFFISVGFDQNDLCHVEVPQECYKNLPSKRLLVQNQLRRTKCEICSKLTIKTLYCKLWTDFAHWLVFPLLTLNKYMPHRCSSSYLYKISCETPKWHENLLKPTLFSVEIFRAGDIWPHSEKSFTYSRSMFNLYTPGIVSLVEVNEMEHWSEVD